jgi:hypothetical protein
MEPADLGDRRFQRGAEVLWRLGPRPHAEFFGALGREHLIRTATEVKLRLYATVRSSTLDGQGGSWFRPTLIFNQIIEFADRAPADRFQAMVLDLIRAAHPGAL